MSNALRSFFNRLLSRLWLCFLGGVGWWSCYLHATTSWTTSSTSWLSTVPTASKTWWRHRLRLRIFWRVFHSRAFWTLVCTLFSKPCATFLDAIMRFTPSAQFPNFSFKPKTFYSIIVQQVKRNIQITENVLSSSSEIATNSSVIML